MADFFGSIATQEIGATRATLHKRPLPADPGVRFFLQDGGERMTTPPKMTTRAQMEAEIAAQKEKYAPFFRRFAPEITQYREREMLKMFDFREETDEDRRDFLSVLAGSGSWRRVEIPHYEGPLGRKTTYYRTTFRAALPRTGEAVFLRFDGVDYMAEVYVNGALVGTHEGFFAPFSCEIGDVLKDGENVLLVKVKNDFTYGGSNAPTYGDSRLEGEKLYAATGPGFDDPQSGWHHCPPGMGIYQPVYLERCARTFLSDIFVRPLPQTKEYEVFAEITHVDATPAAPVSLRISVFGHNFEATVLKNFTYIPVTFAGDTGDGTVYVNELSTREGAKPLTFYRGENLVRLRFSMENVRLWTPDAPYLYEVQIALSLDGREVDMCSATFGMRSFSMGEENGKKGMFFLNGESIRLRGANTMGYEQQDVMRADDEMLLSDMLMAKVCGMNFLRLTQRPVQKEIYALCDRIGLMIQTDLPLFTNMRRTKFAQALRQCEEMERLIRPYACTVLITYINEPMVNASDKPHRHMTRGELEAFFHACDSAVHILNPDRVIKHVDGDYDPPSDDLPDYHNYTMWYNGHGIDAGRLYRGEWTPLPDGWYCACGEYGAEGLDSVDLMRRRYPAEWLPQNEAEEREWLPSRIKDAQSGNMFRFFYDKPDTLEEWVEASREHQRFATKWQTEAFRRNADMVSFAIHLFIDAWPSGWMKTIVDCERDPKPAFFAYRDALTPLMVSLRSDRRSFFAGEQAEIECFICNDTHIRADGHILRFELCDEAGDLIASGESDAMFGENTSTLCGKVVCSMPQTDTRSRVTLRAILMDASRHIIHDNEESFDVFAPVDPCQNSARFLYGIEEYRENEEQLLREVSEGGTLILCGLRAGKYTIAGSDVTVKSCGMRPLHFVSRKTGHPLVEGFLPQDFRLWYDEKEDRITPLISATFLGDDFTPVLVSGNNLVGSAWGKPVLSALALGEKSYGKGKIVICQVDLESHLKNPVAQIFKNKLASYPKI